MKSKLAWRTKWPVWNSLLYFPFAIYSLPSNFAAGEDLFIAQGEDSMAVNLIWCCSVCILCYAKEPGTEDFREVCGQKCWMHSAKAFPEPLASLWKPPQVFLGQRELLHFCTVPLYWAIVFFNHRVTGSKATCSELRESWALLLCGLWEELTAVADPACLHAELLRHRENPNLF